MCDLCFSSLEEISCLVVFGVYYVNFSAEPLKAVLFWCFLECLDIDEMFLFFNTVTLV